jgi:hypothetical protein
MNDVLLNVEKVKRLRKERGMTVEWLYRQLGMSRTSGYLMFTNGLLPKNVSRRKAILKKLATLLGAESSQLTLRFEAESISA